MPDLVTALYRRGQQTITADTVARIANLWRLIDPAEVDKAWPIVSRAMTQIVAGNYSASTALAVDYLTKHAAAAGVDLTTVLTAPTLDLAALSTSLQVTGPVAVKQSAALGRSAEQAAQVALVRLSGAASRIALSGGRGTIDRTVTGSEQILGYRRETDGRPCFFCAMLASRGSVYKSQQTATTRGGGSHRFHDHCSCSAVPLYEHEDEPEHVQALSDKWADVTRGHSGQAAVNAWRAAYAP